MENMKYLDIDKNLIPYRFQTPIAGVLYDFMIRYNKRFDFFTMDLSKDGIPIVTGDKIVYGRMLFETCQDDSKTPEYPITPFDIMGENARVGWDDLVSNVFLYIGDPND